MRTDLELQQAVQRELRWDARVRETDVSVQVNDGVVALTGTLASWSERDAAQEAAHRVADVHDVVNELVVRLPINYYEADIELAHAVRTALQCNILVPEDHIQSTVAHGVVMLTGCVDFATQSQDAETTVRSLPGVRQVINGIRTKRAHFVACEDVKRAIEDALTRRTARELNRIELEVDEGRVKLSGFVHSWAERRAALGAAKSTPGVLSVVDHLRIEL